MSEGQAHYNPNVSQIINVARAACGLHYQCCTSDPDEVTCKHCLKWLRKHRAEQEGEQ